MSFFDRVLQETMSEPVLKGMIQALAGDWTYVVVKEHAEGRRSLGDIAPPAERAIQGLARNKTLRERVTFQVVMEWWGQANPGELSKINADPQTAVWMRRMWEQCLRAADIGEM